MNRRAGTDDGSENAPPQIYDQRADVIKQLYHIWALSLYEYRPKERKELVEKHEMLRAALKTIDNKTRELSRKK